MSGVSMISYISPQDGPRKDLEDYFQEILDHPPFSHEENSLTERSYAETLRHLRPIVYEHLTYKDWRIDMPLVQRIINAQYLIAIGCTAPQKFLGEVEQKEGIRHSTWPTCSGSRRS
jgi:hypothetical protein